MGSGRIGRWHDMAATAIPVESPTWTGTPRANSNQYIQTAITAGNPGDIYTLGVGIHRGQEFTLAAGDTLILAAGASLNGGEDVGTSGWADEGAGVYSKTLQAGDRNTVSGVVACDTGYSCDDLEVVVIDGEMRAWYTTLGAVDANGCYDDGTDIYIYGDPTGYDLIEITRATQIVAGNTVTIRGESAAERGSICNYSSSDVHQDAGIVVGTDFTMRNIHLKSFAGCAIQLQTDSQLYNVTVSHCGQLGASCGLSKLTYYEDIIFGEGHYFHTNGIGGWDNGNEGGNIKLSNTDRTIVKGGLWDVGTMPHPDTPPAPFWLDINNDGFQIFASTFKDSNDESGRGLFLEISYSGKVHDNILYKLAASAENDFWGNGIVMDGTGADTTYSEFSTLEIYHNLLYLCSGGVATLQSGGRTDWNEAYEDGAGYRRLNWDYWMTKNVNAHHNTTYFNGASGFADNVGTIDGLDAATEPHDIAFEDNIYIVEAADSRYNDETSGGTGVNLAWATWNTAGFDDTGAQHVASDYNPDPFNGGSL